MPQSLALPPMLKPKNELALEEEETPVAAPPAARYGYLGTKMNASNDRFLLVPLLLDAVTCTE